jgi:hypothetical protein
MRQIGTILFFVGIPLLGRADILLFSDYGPGNTYNTSNGWTVGTGSTLNDLQPAAAFTASATGTVSQIDVSVGYLSGTNAVTVNLLNDSGGIPTGKPLESWMLPNLLPFGSPGKVETLSSAVPTVSVVEGKTYWLQLAPADNTTDAFWYLSDSSVGSFYGTDSNGPAFVGNQYLPAFQVLGTPVPEPSFLVLIVVGLIALCVVRKRAYAR